MVGWKNGDKDEPSAGSAENQIPIFLERIEGGASLNQILEIAGRPNIFLEGSPGSGKLCYFWLTGTNLIFNITKGRKDGHAWTFYEEDLR